jgi:hypothetical protein
MPFGRSLCESQDVAGLLQRETGKKAQFNYLGSFGLFLREFLQRFIEEQQSVVVHVRRDFNLVQIEPFPSPATLAGCFATRVINEDVAHGFRGGGKKVAAIGESRMRLVAGKPKPGLVHESGGLQRVARGFIGHARDSQLAEFIIDQRQEFIGGVRVARLRSIQDKSHSAHDLVMAKTIGTIRKSL